jgi:hypothetical protein
MKIQALLSVLVFMTPSMVCLIFAWRAKLTEPSDSQNTKLRARLLAGGIGFATLSQLLVIGFLFQGYDPDAQSFATPLPRPWIISNWIAVFGWLCAIVAIAGGKGRARRPLILWTLVTPAAAFFFEEMAYIY